MWIVQTTGHGFAELVRLRSHRVARTKARPGWQRENAGRDDGVKGAARMGGSGEDGVSEAEQPVAVSTGKTRERRRLPLPQLSCERP
jgi:hypothetical protein